MGLLHLSMWMCLFILTSQELAHAKKQTVNTTVPSYLGDTQAAEHTQIIATEQGFQENPANTADNGNENNDQIGGHTVNGGISSRTPSWGVEYQNHGIIRASVFTLELLRWPHKWINEMETNSDPYLSLDPPCYQLRIAKESMPSTFKENFLGCRSRELGENELQLVIYMAEVFSDLRADCHDECRTNALLQMLSSWNEVVNRHFNATADELQIENNNNRYRVQAQKIVGYLTEDGLTLNSSTHHWDLRREQGAKQFVMYLVQSIGSQFPLILIDWTLGKSLRSLSVEMQFMLDVTEMAVIESSDLIRRVTSLSEQYRRSVKLSEFRIEAPTLPDPTKRLFQECDEIKSAELEPVQQPNEANYGEELKLAKMEQINVDVNTVESPQNIEENVERNTNDQETESLLRDPQSALIVSGKLSANGSILNSWFDKWNTKHGLEDKQFILHLMRTVNKEDPLILIETKKTQGVLTLHIKFRLVLDMSETAGVNPEALIELLTILTKKHGESSTRVDFEIKKKPITEKNKEHEIQDTPIDARRKQDNEFANLASSFQSEKVHEQAP